MFVCYVVFSALKEKRVKPNVRHAWRNGSNALLILFPVKRIGSDRKVPIKNL